MAQTLVLESQLPSRVIHQFPNPTFIENLAIRSNGKILVTVVNGASLMMVDPQNPSTPTLIHKFEGVLAVTGVIEVEHDIFYVAAGNFDLKAGNETGSYSIWKVDMSGFEEEGKAKTEMLTTLPNAGLPNGFESLPKDKTCFLFADSEAGNVVKVNVNTGASEVLIDLEEMKHGPEGMPLGINGIKYKDGYLYWTTTVKKIFCRIKVDDHGDAVGKAEIVARDILADDFTLDKKGNAWLTTHSNNTIVVVKTDGTLVTAAGRLDELTVAGGTACQFGRGKDDGHVLYVTTCGGLTAPVGGDKVEGGKIIAIDTSTFE
jgi:sugar lactone lactonase YvrE